jgi:hypothetical protein
MAFQNLFILGSTGNVGRTLLEQITAHDGTDHGHRNPTVIAGIANSTNFILSPGGIALPERINRESMRAFLSDSENNTQPYSEYSQMLEAVRKSGMEGEIIFVDATAE